MNEFINQHSSFQHCMSSRRIIEYYGAVVISVTRNIYYGDNIHDVPSKPLPISNREMLIPHHYTTTPVSSITSNQAYSRTLKSLSAITCLKFSHDGSRLLICNDKGEVHEWLVYKGMPHPQDNLHYRVVTTDSKSIKCLCFMNDGTYFLTGDVGGIVTIYKPNVEKMIAVKAHVPILEKTSSYTVTSITTSPTNFMFCSSAEDASIKIWDLGKISQRQKLPLRKYGHGGNVLTVDWHPMRGLIVSGSENNMIKFWDPRNKNCIGNIYDHTSRVNVVEFNRNGNWLLSASNDQTCRIFDIRMNRQMECFKGHNQEINCANWHPIHEDLLVSGSKDGKIFYWIAGLKATPLIKNYHHDNSITCISWNPMGYLLATGSMKANVKLWTRARPCEIFSNKTA